LIIEKIPDCLHEILTLLEAALHLLAEGKYTRIVPRTPIGKSVLQSSLVLRGKRPCFDETLPERGNDSRVFRTLNILEEQCRRRSIKHRVVRPGHSEVVIAIVEKVTGAP
jgi:hypothetical protein